MFYIFDHKTTQTSRFKHTQLDQGSIHLIEQVFMFDDVGIIHVGGNKAIFERYSLLSGYTLFGLTPPQGSVQVSWCGISPSPDSIGIMHSGREYLAEKK